MSWINTNLSSSVLGISDSDLKGNRTDAKVENFQKIASYNWAPDSKPGSPLIVVPGMPKRKTDWKGGQLQPDSTFLSRDGLTMVDENRFMMPKYPMEPIFHALEICQEIRGEKTNMLMQEYDLVSDRNNIRKLFKFAHSSVAEEDFRIDIERIENLVFFIRHDKFAQAAHEYASKCFAKDLEKKLAKAQHPLTEGTFRQIVEYKFGDYKLLLRFEVDCADYGRTKDSSDAELAGAMAASGLGDYKVEKAAEGSEMSLIRFGQLAPWHLVELTTKIVGRPLPEHKWDQIYFSRTGSLGVGWQKWGNVKKVEFIEYDQAMTRLLSGGFPTRSLAKTHSLIDQILKFVRSQKEGEKYAIVGKQGSGQLQIYKRQPGSGDMGSLPDEYKAKLKKVIQK